MLETLQGRLERIVYFNKDSLYTVAKLNIKGKQDLVTAVGQLAGSNPGETLKLSGAWEFHPKYGQQFRAASCTVSLPAKVEGVEKYLGSGLIKGIGPEMAKRLVGKFGVKTLEIMEHNPEKLLGVDGIGKKRLQTIRNAWENQSQIRDVMIFLQGQGVGAGHSAKIFKQYGQDTIRLLRENPYRLSRDIIGIGFITADNIARKLGVPTNSVKRAEAGLLHVLERLSESGHVHGLYGDVLKRAEELLEIDGAIIKEAFDSLLSSKHIIAEDFQDNYSGAFQADTPVYLKAFYAVEKGLANRLKAFLSVPVQQLKLQEKKIKKVVQKRLAVILSQEQWSALQTSLSSKVSIITGGPGTGKTTLVRAILAVFEKAGKQFLLCAPTGRAAKRLSEVTGWSAKTIHRLLAYNFKSGSFMKNEETPLDTDVVIVDETSMIDLFLMYHLVKAIPVTATLVLVGDVNQLPPVGPGNVLRDMIDSRQVPTVYLNEIFRQARESLIVVNAHRINEGLSPTVPDSSHNDLRDFYLIEQNDPEKVLSTIQELCCVRIPQRFKLDPLSDIQVLTPMHRGIVGTTNLNRVLQETLNPSKLMIRRTGCVFKQGDKVMQIKNNYIKEVFNGDIGTITKIDVEVRKVTVLYDEYPVDYEFAEQDELILAYAISVHKSQGSEYGAVILPVMTQHFVLLQRNLIYTGITRAKKLVVLIGTKKALAIAIKNDTPLRRLTRLSDRLRQA